MDQVIPDNASLDNTGSLLSVSDPNAGQSLSLSGPTTQPVTASADAIDQRAVKTAMATGDTVENVKPQLQSPGGADRLVQRANQNNALDNQQKRIDLINGMISDRDPSKPMSPDEIGYIRNLSDDQLHQVNYDPQILEQKYAEAATRVTFANADSKVYTTGVYQDPDSTDHAHDVANGIIRTKEFIQKLSEDNTDTSNSVSSWGKYLGDKALQFVPLVSDWAKYDKSAASGESWMPGDNMAQQMENLWLMKPIDREAKIQQQFDSIKSVNPQDALDWLDNVKAFGTSDASWKNLMTAVDVASVIPIGTVAKGLKAAGAVGKGVAEGAADLAEGDLRSQVLKGPGAAAPARDITAGDTRSITAQGPGVPVPARDLTTGDARSQVIAQVDKAAQDSVLALKPANIDPIKVLDQTGQVDKATDAIVQKEFMKASDPTIRGTDASEMADKLNSTSSVFNTTKFLSDTTTLSAENSARLLEATARRRALLDQTLYNSSAAMRLTPEAEAQGIENTKTLLTGLYTRSNDAIMDFGFADQTKTEGQLNQVTMRLGKTSALPFDTKEEAVQAAEVKYGIKPSDYTVDQKGQSFTIKVSRPIDETDPSLTNVKLNTSYTQTPQGFWNTFLGKFRSPEDLLSQESRDNRSVVTSATQEHIRLYQDAIAPSLQRLTSKEKGNLDKYMQTERDFQDGETRGKFADSVGEFEQKYNDLFKTYPKEHITDAYLAMRDMSDFDLTVRSLAMKRDLGSKGIVNVLGEHETNVPHPGGASAYKVDKIKFQGKEVDHLPEAAGKDNPGVYVQKRGYDGGHSLEWKSLQSVDRTELKKLTEEQGYKVYQAADPHTSPFADITGDKAPASYYVMKGADTANLNAADMIPYKAGYHVEYPNGYYTKIPTFFHDPEGQKYVGSDLSISHFTTEAQASKYTKLMNQARGMLKDGDEAGFNAFVTKNLPHTPEEFKGIYAKSGADVNTPFMYTKQGMSTSEAATGHMGEHAGLFDGAQDLSASQHSLVKQWGVNKKFTQEKNLALPTIRDNGEFKPVFDFKPSQNISPMATMQRQMHSLVRMRVYDDYVKQSINSFIKDFANPEAFGGSVTRWDMKGIQNNPLSFIADPKWDKNVLNKDRLAAAQNVHRSIQTLLNSPSDFSRNVDWYMNKVASSAYERFGEDFAQKVSDYSHFSITDPAKYARSIAFHMKLGLFNPIMMFIHSQAAFHTIALTGNPIRSWKAIAGSGLMRFLSLTDNPDVIDSFAKKASAFGWNPEDFKEAHSIMKSSGIWNVEGDVAQLDDAMSSNYLGSKGRGVLNKGLVLFKETVRATRLHAYNTAYLEWKAAHPGELLAGNQRAINSVLTRADDLSMNMSAKSTAAMQKGIFSTPLQFSTYAIHMSEQMLGKRLTVAEKTRAMLMYSTLYGLPAAATATMPLVDWGTDIKEAALNRGIDLNSGALDGIMHGILSTGIEGVTGKQTTFGDRVGPYPLNFVSDAVSGKKTAWELATGPSGQFTADLFKAASRLASPTISAIADAGKGTNESYPLNAEDFISAFRNITTVDSAMKFYTAANFHKYMNKNGVNLADADSTDGALGAFMGAEPRSISDANIKQEMLSSIKTQKLGAQKEVVLNIQRALDNAQDPDAWMRYMKIAKLAAIGGGMNEQDYIAAGKQAVSDKYISKVDANDKLWLKKGPNGLANLYSLSPEPDATQGTTQ